MSPSLKPSTQEKLKRFNELFPPFYGQFVSSEAQVQNLRLAYQVYKYKTAVIQFINKDDRTLISCAAHNQAMLLRDLFGVLAVYNLAIHDLNIYGQVQPPNLIFVRLTVSRGGKALPEKVAENVRRAMREALLDRFEIEEMVSVELFNDNALAGVQTEFYIDQVFHLPALMIEAPTQDGLFYKIMNAIAQEDVLVVNANFLLWQKRTRLILYVLNSNAAPIPDYVGNKIAERVRRGLA